MSQNRKLPDKSPVPTAILATALIAVIAVILRTPTAADDPMPSPLPVVVTPLDRHIRFIGRFDVSDPNGPRCAWSACGVELRFQGTAMNAVIDDSGDDRYQVVVDGWPRSVIAASPDHHLYKVVDGLALGRHTVEIVKRTEPDIGFTQFLSFQLDAGARMLPPPRPPRRRLLVIGDSISAGYGNEGLPSDKFSPDTENAYLTYGAVAARFLKADYQCIAWSGKKLWPDDDIPSIYDQTAPGASSSPWDGKLWRPDVIVINLGSNDVDPSMPDRTGWTQAASTFIAHLRLTAPHAMIYLGLGPMLSDTNPSGQHQLSTVRSYLLGVVALRKTLGDPRVRLIEFPTENPTSGTGADLHPNIKTHEEMAEELAATIRTDLRWR